MNARAAEAHVELLLGRVVVDVVGAAAGRIEELHAEVVDGELVVTEFHLGPGALLERIAGFLHELPILARLPMVGRTTRVRWSDMDLADPDRPRLRVRRDQLAHAAAEEET